MVITILGHMSVFLQLTLGLPASAEGSLLQLTPSHAVLWQAWQLQIQASCISCATSPPLLLHEVHDHGASVQEGPGPSFRTRRSPAQAHLGTSRTLLGSFSASWFQNQVLQGFPKSPPFGQPLDEEAVMRPSAWLEARIISWRSVPQLEGT